MGTWASIVFPPRSNFPDQFTTSQPHGENGWKALSGYFKRINGWPIVYPFIRRAQHPFKTFIRLVFAHYLAGAISLRLAAELLGSTRLDLRTRCVRLDVPLHTAPATPEEARAVAELALHLSPGA